MALFFAARLRELRCMYKRTPKMSPTSSTSATGTPTASPMSTGAEAASASSGGRGQSLRSSSTPWPPSSTSTLSKSPVKKSLSCSSPPTWVTELSERTKSADSSQSILMRNVTRQSSSTLLRRRRRRPTPPPSNGSANTRTISLSSSSMLCGASRRDISRALRKEVCASSVLKSASERPLRAT